MVSSVCGSGVLPVRATNSISPPSHRTSKPSPCEPSGHRARYRPHRLREHQYQVVSITEAARSQVDKSVRKSNRYQIAEFFDSIDPKQTLDLALPASQRNGLTAFSPVYRRRVVDTRAGG